MHGNLKKSHLHFLSLLHIIKLDLLNIEKIMENSLHTRDDLKVLIFTL